MIKLTRTRNVLLALSIIAVLLVGTWAADTAFRPVADWRNALWGNSQSVENHAINRAQNGLRKRFHVELVPGKPKTIRFEPAHFEMLRLSTTPVQTTGIGRTLRLPGSLLLDPNHLIRVHSRFPGEIVSIGLTDENAVDGAQTGSPKKRRLRYGDRVQKGQVMVVVWSREIGEKKSELVDAISKSAADKAVLDKLKKVEKGVVAERVIIEAQRSYDADVVALAKAERTLRSWKLTDEEIQVVYAEAEEIRLGRIAPDNDHRWAELEIRAPIDALIVEKNYNEGAIIGTDDDLFTIADVSKLQVLANAYEEDLPALRALPPSQRNWRIDLKSDPYDKPRSGTFEIFGAMIDPQQHTGTVIGWLDNSEGQLAAGQFITASIDLPADERMVVIPPSALIERGDRTFVFVRTSEERLEFTLREVEVARRGHEFIYVFQNPESSAASRGAEPLHIGEEVIKSTAMELADELERLNDTLPTVQVPSPRKGFPVRTAPEHEVHTAPEHESSRQ